MIKIDNLRFRYKNREHDTINIQSWHIKHEDIVFLSGHSGSGKSTLINILAGLLNPDQGTISIDGILVEQLKPKLKNKFRANHIGLISQQFNLIPYLSVFENINLAHSFRKGKKADLTNDVNEMMEKLKLQSSLLYSKASELSIGQQQRVAIIRAMINKPKLLLADEPTSALDHQAKFSFIELLNSMAIKHQMTLLFISHDVTLKRYFPTTVDMEQINVA